MRFDSRWLTLTTVCVTALLALDACSHSFHYKPEVDGEGAIWNKGAVEYGIPPDKPVFHLKIVARHIQGPPEGSHLPSGTQMIHLRLILEADSTAPANAKAYLDPSEQTVGKSGAKPAAIRATSSDRPRIYAAPGKKQLVGLFYALPDGRNDTNLESFRFHWRIHLGDGSTEEQVTRFDRYDTAPDASTDFSNWGDNDETIGGPGWGWW